MLAKIKLISDGAYDLVKALENANVKQTTIDEFRKKVEPVDIVPKSILDKQVIKLKEVKVKSSSQIFFINFSFFHFWRRVKMWLIKLLNWLAIITR